MNALTALLSVAIVAWVLLWGSLFDFGDPYSRTAFAAGVSVMLVPFLAVDAALRRAEGRR